MDRALVSELLAEDADAASIREEVASAQRMGVSGVPTFIIADTYAVVGAQPPEQLTQAFQAVAAQQSVNDNAPA